MVEIVGSPKPKICTFKILKLFLEGSVSIFRMCMASSDFLLSFGYVLSEFLAYLSGLRASTGTGGMNGCKGLSGNRTERSEGELRNAPCIQKGSCYDAH